MLFDFMQIQSETLNLHTLDKDLHAVEGHLDLAI